MTETNLYSRRFDQANKHWSRHPGDNYNFLVTVQAWMNDRLRSRGFLFVNEVQEALGLDWTPNGQLVGWLKENGSHVDFNITEVEDEPGVFILNFNPDGVMYDKI